MNRKYEAPRLTIYGELKQLTKNKALTGSAEQIFGRDEIMKAFFKRIADAFESLKRSRNRYDPELKITLAELKARITIAFDWAEVTVKLTTIALGHDYYRDPTALKHLINQLERIIFGTEPEDEKYRQNIIDKLQKQELARRKRVQWEMDHPEEVAELKDRLNKALRQFDEENSGPHSFSSGDKSFK